MVGLFRLLVGQNLWRYRFDLRHEMMAARHVRCLPGITRPHVPMILLCYKYIHVEGGRVIHGGRGVRQMSSGRVGSHASASYRSIDKTD